LIASLLSFSASFAQTAGSSELTVSSEDLDGNQIDGYFVSLEQDGEEIDTDFTPAGFTLENSEEYVVEVQDFEEYVFDHWQGGSSSRDRNVEISSDTELVAVYRNTEEDEEVEEEDEPPTEDEQDALDELLEESRINEPELLPDEGIVEAPLQQEQVGCFDYDQLNGTLNVICDADLIDVIAEGIGSSILQAYGPGEYILNANVSVADNATLTISGGQDFDHLKIAGGNGITVSGRIEIENLTVTSWDTAAQSTIDIANNTNASRGYLFLTGSEGGHIINSTFGFMGYNDTGYRGVDLMDRSHNFTIRNSTFHNMWYAFYSNAAYNITIDSSEYRDNLRYAIDPHSGTHNMTITNNHIYNNSDTGIICSLDCYGMLFEGNVIHGNNGSGIVFSRNTTDSIARYNTIYNETDGIVISESSSNQVYANNITNVMRAIYLVNPVEADDGRTTSNDIYNNTIGDAQYGVVARRSQTNALSDNNFAGNITSAHYFLTGNSTFGITNQTFSETEIRGRDGQNIVGIASSGLITIDDETRVNTNTSAFTRILTNQTLVVNSTNSMR
jgi:hypothetical protein